MQQEDDIKPILTRPAGDNGLFDNAYQASRKNEIQLASAERWREVLREQPAIEMQPGARDQSTVGDDELPNVGAESREHFEQIARRNEQDNIEPGEEDGAGELVIKTITDLPLQTLGALRDAGQGLLDTGHGFAEWLEGANIPSFYIQYMDPDTGELDFEILSTKEARQHMKDMGGLKRLPSVAKAKTGAGHFYRKTMQFLLPFSKVTKALSGTKTAASLGTIGTDLVAGAMTDFLFWEKQEDRLSDLIQSYPALQNPVTEFLASDEDDPILLDKLKIAMEGAALGGLFHGLVSGIRWIKANRAANKAKDAAKAQGLDIDIAARQAKQVEDDLAGSVLGAPDKPPVEFRRVPADEAEAMAAKTHYRADIEDIKPEEVTAAAKAKQPAEVPLNDIGRPVINFRTIDAPEDIDNVLREMTGRLEDTATAAKGGIISHDETIALAREVGIKELLDPAFDVARFNRGELVALKDLYVASGEKLLQVADQATSAPTTANLYAFRKMMAVHNEIYGRFVGAKAEAGRALNALAIPARAGNMERLQSIQNILEEMGGEQVAKNLAEKIASLKHAEPEALTEIVKRGAFAKTMDAIQEAWVLGLVSGPASQARNILSNAAYMYQQMVERGIAARMPGSDVEKGEALAYAFGTIQSLKQAFINTGKAFKTGQAGHGIGKIDLPHRKAISGESLGWHGPMGYVADGIGEFYRVWGRMLTAGDEFFKTMNYNGELWAQAARKAAREGGPREDFADRLVKYAMDPDESARIAGIEAANYSTFTQKLGKLGSHWQTMVNEYPPLRFLTPFIRTPGNIFKAGFARSPFAVFMPETFWQAVKAGGAEKDMALARVAFGSTAMALFSDITMRGFISGSGPTDPGERARLRDTGWSPYSINIGAIEGGQDKWINYRAIEPIGMVLGLSADITELMMERQRFIDSDDPEEQAKADRLTMAAIAAVGNSVTSQTFVRSISEFFNMMANPDMYANRWLQNYARTVVPRLSASIERQVDPELRHAYSLIDSIKADIPGLSGDLPPMRNTFGHPIELGGALGPDWISPIWMSEDKNSPIADELVRQGIRLGKPQRVTGFPDESFGVNVKINLRDFPKAYDRYQALAGHELKHPAFGLGMEDLFNQIVTNKHYLSEVYNQLMDGDEQGVDDKGAFLKDIAGEYRAMAKRELLREFPDLRDEIQRRAQRKYNLQLEGAGL